MLPAGGSREPRRPGSLDDVEKDGTSEETGMKDKNTEVVELDAAADEL